VKAAPKPAPKAASGPPTTAALLDTIDALVFRLGGMVGDLGRLHKAGDDGIAAAITGAGEAIGSALEDVAAVLREIAQAIEAGT